MSSKAELIAAVGSEASTCVRCHLHITRRNVVFGVGNPEAPLVLVGEGPGEQEDASGIPFVGRAGILLDECLAANGITRKHIYICNVVKCRACIIEGKVNRNRPPTQDEIDTCNPWLDRQLSIIKPLVILCIGSWAANTVIHRNFKIVQERGQWFSDCPYAKYTIAALHPAYILRQAGEGYIRSRELLIHDINTARLKVIEAKKEPPKSLFESEG